MARTVDIDVNKCKACGACEAICPEVFRVDENLGYAVILRSPPYPEDEINAAIIACPGRCIDWAEGAAQEDYFCQKFQERITTDPICRHPKDYCQFRSACPLHFLGSLTK